MKRREDAISRTEGGAKGSFRGDPLSMKARGDSPVSASSAKAHPSPKGVRGGPVLPVCTHTAGPCSSVPRRGPRCDRSGFVLFFYLFCPSGFTCEYNYLMALVAPISVFDLCFFFGMYFALRNGEVQNGFKKLSRSGAPDVCTPKLYGFFSEDEISDACSFSGRIEGIPTAPKKRAGQGSIPLAACGLWQRA